MKRPRLGQAAARMEFMLRLVHVHDSAAWNTGAVGPNELEDSIAHPVLSDSRFCLVQIPGGLRGGGGGAGQQREACN